MNYQVKDLENVEKYIWDKLQQNEIERLWIRFLKEPGLFRYFKTQVQIVSLAKDVKEGKRDSPFQ